MALSIRPAHNWGDFAEPERELVKELVAEPLVGHRIWPIVRSESVTFNRATLDDFAARFDRGENPFRGLLGARLGSAGVNGSWGSRRMTAICHPMVFWGWRVTAVGGPDAPHRHCQCGFWALKNLDDLHVSLADYANGEAAEYAYGTVRLWGRIYEHEKGYRAQHAQPVTVTLVNGSEETRQELEAFYGCPVVLGEWPAGTVELWKAREIETGPGAVIPVAVGGLAQFVVTNGGMIPTLSQWAEDEPDPDRRSFVTRYLDWCINREPGWAGFAAWMGASLAVCATIWAGIYGIIAVAT